MNDPPTARLCEKLEAKHWPEVGCGGVVVRCWGKAKACNERESKEKKMEGVRERRKLKPKKWHRHILYIEAETRMNERGEDGLHQRREQKADNDVP
jgi:hypothetical protein